MLTEIIQLPEGYYAKFTPDSKGLLVTFRDVPEAIAQGNNIEDATVMATESLATALETIKEYGQMYPIPSLKEENEIFIPVKFDEIGNVIIPSLSPKEEK